MTQFNFIAPPINRGWDGQSDIGLVFYHHADDAAYRKSLSPAMVAARGTKINPTDQTHLSEAETFNFEPSHDPLSYRRTGVPGADYANFLSTLSCHSVLLKLALPVPSFLADLVK